MRLHHPQFASHDYHGVNRHSTGLMRDPKIPGRSLRAQPGDYFLPSVGAKSRSRHGGQQSSPVRFLDSARKDGPIGWDFEIAPEPNNESCQSTAVPFHKTRRRLKHVQHLVEDA